MTIVGLLALSSANGKLLYTDSRFLGKWRRVFGQQFRKIFVPSSSKSPSPVLSENYSDTPKRRNVLAQRQRHIVADLNVLQLYCQNLQSCHKWTSANVNILGRHKCSVQKVGGCSCLHLLVVVWSAKWQGLRAYSRYFVTRPCSRWHLSGV